MPKSLRSAHGDFRPAIAFHAAFLASHLGPIRLLTVSCVVTLIVCLGCGAVGPATPAPVNITIMPISAQPFPGETVQFQASVQNASSSNIAWQVNQISGGNTAVGTISPTGLYTAPTTVPNPPVVTVNAILQSGTTATTSAIVTIQDLSTVKGPLIISPKLSSITTSQTIPMNILTAGVNNAAVIWSVDGVPNGNLTVGTISSSGVYSPSSETGPHVITAILKANPAAIGSATIEVNGLSAVWTWRNDNMRSGINNQELVLSPTTVSRSSFGKLFSCPLDGNAYAQPLYVPNLAIAGNGTHNVVFVATESDSVYAFDADTGPCVQLWQQHSGLVPAGSQAVASPDRNTIFPTVGITGTPVIDVNSSTLYVVAATQTIGVMDSTVQRLFALDLTTGIVKNPSVGVQISSPPGQAFAFTPTNQNQRAALLLDNGTVFVAFGSFSEQGDYNGWLFAYDSETLNPTGAFDITPGSFQGHGGIWQGGGGPSADANHNVFVTTGNGHFNPNVQGLNSDFVNSILRLAPAGGIFVSDYFTPCDVASGQVLGTTAAVLLPDSAGSLSQPHLLIGGSKGNSLYVVNRDNMGKFSGPCPDSAERVQTVSVGGAILGSPLFWDDSIYVAPANGRLMSFSMSGGITALAANSSQSPEQLGPQGATPVISSNGTTNAILWLIDTSGAQVAPYASAVLRAYDASNLSNEIYSSPVSTQSPDAAGLAVKFSVPTVANGKVYVGTQTELDVYGLQ